MLVLGTLLALVLSARQAAPPAAARSLALNDFQMTAEVARDGSVPVQETITARFEGFWNGIVRLIPLLANRATGLEPLGVTIESVTDAHGRPYRVESQPRGGERELRIFIIPNARDASRTVVLRYNVRHGMGFYRGHDELNWNVTGNGWGIPIQRVSARVVLPEGVRGVHASVCTGPRGARGRDAELRVDPRQVTARFTRALNPGEGLPLAVGFEGLVRPRPRTEQLQLWLQGRLALLLPVLTGVVFGGLWWWHGRDWAVGTVPVR